MTTQADKDWLTNLGPGVEWINDEAFGFQVDGNDLVQISNIDPSTGMAQIRVYSSVDPDAEIICEDIVQLRLTPKHHA
jgi:hypothetical protein